MDIELLDITDSVYYKVSKGIKNNKNESRELVRRKLTRNMLLGIPINKTKYDSGTEYSFDRERFLVEDGVVTWIDYDRPRLPIWFLKREEFRALNEKLEIDKLEKEETNTHVSNRRKLKSSLKNIKEARKHLLYLKRDLSKELGEEHWIVNNLETALTILDS